MEDWYSINIDKVSIKDDYQNGVLPIIPSEYNKKKPDPIDLYQKYVEMDEKLANVLNEVRESHEVLEKKMDYIEEKLNMENLKLKNTLLEKELELERMKNALVRHKISFPFTPTTIHKYFQPKTTKNFIEKFLNAL